LPLNKIHIRIKKKQLILPNIWLILPDSIAKTNYKTLNFSSKLQTVRLQGYHTVQNPFPCGREIEINKRELIKRKKINKGIYKREIINA